MYCDKWELKFLICHATSHNQMVKWLYGWESFTLGYHATSFGGLTLCGSGDKLFLICHVISKEDVFNGLCVEARRRKSPPNHA